MRITTQLFDSGVARRIFILFVLASLVPLLALALLLTKRVGAALESQAFEQLENAARGYGQVTLDKLLSAAGALPETRQAQASGAFGLDAAATLDADGVHPLFGDWSPSLDGLEIGRDRPVLAVLPGADAYDIAIAHRRGAEIFVGRVDPEYLWRTSALLGRGMEICVLGSPTLASAVSCSSPLASDAREHLRAAMQSASSGRLDWSDEGSDWLAVYWQLFLPSRFEAEPWTIVVSQPRGVALASLDVLNRTIPQAALLTLALIVALALSQIRRTLTPLNALMAGTKRISAQDFATPVGLESEDEFGTLGRALDTMADQLRHQFSALRALADIDRLILQTAAIETVLETLLERLRALVPADEHLVLMVDADDPQHGRIYRARGNQPIELERIRLTDELHRWLGDRAAGHSTTAAALLARRVSLGDWPPTTTLNVAPMLTGDLVGGALLAARASGNPFTERETASIRELANRVAVAIAAGEREAELFRRAHFDALTGLPNRELLEDRLQQAVAQAQREEQSLAVLFIDLDGFKAINDTLGHRNGDEMLKETGLRLATVLRHADTVARLGGDEYAIVLPQVHGPLEAEAVAVKAVEALKQPFVMDGRELFISASIGIAMFPEDGGSAEELLRKADMAMYSAKDAGKACYRFFAEEMDHQIQERHSLHNDLRNALFSDQFFLAYQPQVEFKTQRYVSAEGLLRWRHPRRGLVSPTLFVPVLEATGLINDVGTWVLRRALADFASWQHRGLPFERVAINVSARQLLDPNFVDTVMVALKDANVRGHNLEIELTEASLVADFRTANAALRKLESHGVRIALDDFGTGYSSLAYLNEIAFDTLKIDRAFVINLPAEKSAAIVKAILAVAKSLGKSVIAEGIETESQYQMLEALGCDMGQGYLISKPLEAAALVAWAENLATFVPQAVGDETRRMWRIDIGYNS